MYLMEKVRVLDELHSDEGYSTIGCECNVNDSTRYVK